MSVASCIATLPGSRFCTLQMEHLIITGNACAAKILKFFVYWTDRKISQVIQARQFNAASEKEGLEALQDESLWIYATITEIRRSLLFEYSEKTIRSAVCLLLKQGFLQSRLNPRHRWDRTTQYLLIREKVQNAIFAIKPEEVADFYEGERIPVEMADFLARLSTPQGSGEIDPLHPVNLPLQDGSFTASIGQIYRFNAADLPVDQKDPLKDQFKDPEKEENDRSALTSDRLSESVPVQVEVMDLEPEEAIADHQTSESLDSVQPEKSKLSRQGDRSAPAQKSRQEYFDDFWAAYPRKIGKPAAEKAFKKVPDSALPLLAPRVIEQKNNYRTKHATGWEFFPHPSTWLNQSRWESVEEEDDSPRRVMTRADERAFTQIANLRAYLAARHGGQQ